MKKLSRLSFPLPKIIISSFSTPIQINPLTFSSSYFYRKIQNELKLTDKCVKKIDELKQKSADKFLRLFIDAGSGCAGFQYNFKIDKQIDDDNDFILEKNNKTYFATDEISLKLLKGSTVDFITELIGSQFQVINNPNAQQSCSCKISFNPKDGLI